MAKNASTVRGQTPKAKSSQDLAEVLRETTKLWRKHHLSYDQSRYVVEQVRRALQLSAPRERRRTVARLDKHEVGRLIEAAYRKGSHYGLMVKTLFYTGARVSEFINIQVVDLRLEGREGPRRLQVLHGVGVDPALAHREPVEAPHRVDGAGGRARGEPALPQAGDEVGQVALLQVEDVPATPACAFGQAREVVAVRDDGVLGEPALDAQVVHIFSDEI